VVNKEEVVTKRVTSYQTSLAVFQKSFCSSSSRTE